MRKTLKNTATAAAVVALAGGLSIAPSLAFGYGDSYSGGGSYDGGSRSFGDALDVVGLAGGTTLYSFSTSDPGRTQRIGTVTLTGDSSLVGIDYRVQNGKLYGVGNLGGIYTIAGATATKVGGLTVALSGTAFGVDFNPAANALRVVSDTGQNLRQPFPAAVNGTFADGPVAATATDAPLTTPPTAGTTTGVSGAAYTNNDLATTTATTLYDLATVTDTVVVQSPANNGTLAATGSLRNDFVGDTGFDIYSKVRDGRAVELFPYAVNSGRLYDVTLFNGDAKDAGRIGDGSITVTDLAIPLNQL